MVSIEARQGKDDVRMSSEHVHASTVVQVPETDRLVVRPGKGAATMATPGHSSDLVRMAAQHAHAVTAFDVPDKKTLVVGAGESMATVPAPSDTQDSGLRRKHAQAAAALRVPHPDSLVGR